MRRTRFDDAPCPIARTTDLIGDWWTPLVLRSFFMGAHRFEEIHAQLSTPRAVLTQRLRRLADEGMIVRDAADGSARATYRLTPKGRAFWPVLAAMWRWGEDWMWPPGESPPVVLRDTESGAAVRAQVIDESTGRPLAEIATRMSRRRPGE